MMVAIGRKDKVGSTWLDSGKNEIKILKTGIKKKNKKSPLQVGQTKTLLDFFSW